MFPHSAGDKISEFCSYNLACLFCHHKNEQPNNSLISLAPTKSALLKTFGVNLEIFFSGSGSISGKTKLSPPSKMLMPSGSLLACSIFQSVISSRNLCIKGDSATGLPSSSSNGRDIRVSFSPVCMSLLKTASRC